MKEFETRPEAAGSSSVRIDQIRSRLLENQVHYTFTDSANKTLGTFAGATLRALRLPYFYQQLDYILSIRNDLDASHAVKLLERCYQADLLEYDRKNYPDNYRDSEEAWLESFEVIDKDDERSGKFLFNMLTRRVQSNIAERYKTIKLITELYGDRFSQAPSHLDVGSSVLHGSLKLAFDHDAHDELSFGDIQLGRPNQARALSGTSELLDPYDRYITSLANAALRNTVEFGHMHGTDITDVDDPGTKKWIESCSYYPDEFSDPLKVAEYAALEQIDPDHARVGFTRADFTDSDDIERLNETAPKNGYDIVTLSTVLYQVPSTAEQNAMISNARELASKNGLIVIQDAPDGNFTRPYNYVTTIKDLAHEQVNDQDILYWETPRCNRAIVGPGKLFTNGKWQSFDEALREANR